MPSGTAPRPKGRAGPETRWNARLLDLHLGARFLELLLDGRGFVLVDAFFYGLGRAIHQILGFFQAQAGDFADRLDDVDLVAAHFGEHDGEFRLLFRWCSTATPRRSAARRNYRRGSRRDAEGFFHLLD